MAAKPTPGFFPGNTLLLEQAEVLASDGEISAIRNAVQNELHWMEHPPEIWHGTILHRYGADPMVMALLQKYMDLYYKTKGVSRPTGGTVRKPWNA